MTDRKFVIDYAREYFGTTVEYLWENTPDAGVLRHSENKKWYGLIMNVSREKFGLSGKEKVDILNVKCEPMLLGSLLMKKSYFPAYHMNKNHWVTVLLDGSLPEEEIIMLLTQSYELTAPVIKKSKNSCDKTK